MNRTEAIEHLKVVLKTCDVQDEEAVEMAIEALEKAPTALDHIHNVVAENAYDKGYDAGHNEGYERGKADAAISAETLAKRLMAKFDDVLSVADVLEELEALEAVAKGEQHGQA